MIFITTQDGTEQYLIEYFHIVEHPHYDYYPIVGLARLNLSQTKLVELGVYAKRKQAVQVFAAIDYNDNDLFYYKSSPKYFEMPESDPPVDYTTLVDLIWHYALDRYFWILCPFNEVYQHKVIMNTNKIVEHKVIIGE